MKLIHKFRLTIYVFLEVTSYMILRTKHIYGGVLSFEMYFVFDIFIIRVSIKSHKFAIECMIHLYMYRFCNKLQLQFV